MSIKCPKCHFNNLDDTVFCGKCATVLKSSEEISITRTETLETPKETLTVGSTFTERYQIIEKLGEGGMGMVYKALDKEIKENIALKVLNPEIAADVQTIDRFRNELKFARKISHENVCRMYDFNKEEKTYFISMEYVSGEDLRTTMRRVGPLSTGKTIFIAKQICEGLAVAHQLGVIHRDLKPQNIMIDREGNVRIMDFGIARSVKAEDLTRTGVMIGTPNYMSPEQAAAEKVDYRTDIYSIGAILFEMVTGHVPFKGDTPLSVALKHKTEPPPDPREFNNQISKELSAVILKCLRKNRDKRFQNAKELLTELSNIESGIPTTERILPKGKTTLKTLKKLFRPLPALGILLVIAVIIVGGYFYINRFQPKKEMEKEEILPAIPEQTPQKAEVLTAQYGNLEINSVPQGAEVYISNKREGITPFNRELPPGAYQIRIRKYPDYKEMTDVLNVRADETSSKSYTLTPTYLLKIETAPEGADVRINGDYKGKTPIQIELPRSICQLRIEKGTEWSSIDESLILNPGITPIQRSLKRIAYSLSIKTDPPGAHVYIGDKLIGISPVKSSDLFGSCDIRIEKEGYKTIEDSLNIESDYEKDYGLIKLESVKIRLIVRPYATVFIDGRSVGEVPPIRILEVEEGKHTIEFFSKSLNKKYSVEVEIKAGESKEIRMNMDTGKSQVVKKSLIQ